MQIEKSFIQLIL